MHPQVYTSRSENVTHHRSIQAAVRSAVDHALRLAIALPGPGNIPAASVMGLPSLSEQLAASNGNDASDSAASHHNGSSERLSTGQQHTLAEGASSPALNGSGTAGSDGASHLSAETSAAGALSGSAPLRQPYHVQLSSAALQGFSLPLAGALTTVSSARYTDHSALLTGTCLLTAYKVELSHKPCWASSWTMHPVSPGQLAQPRASHKCRAPAPRTVTVCC